MSGVYERNRNLSKFEYFNTSIKLRNDILALVTSGAVPKSYRFVFAVPMAETARDLVFNLVKADAFYPNSAHNVEQRRHYMTLAAACCNQLYQDVQSMISLRLPVKVKRFEGLLETIELAEKTIRGARNGVKLIGKG